MEMAEEDGGGNPTHKALNKKVVAMLYKALAAGDGDAVSKLVTSSDDLEWRYHGPPQCQYMMRALTGHHWRREPEDRKFRFKPRRITAFRDRVIVEGWDGLDAYWVHVWALKMEGSRPVVAEFREYFNTWLTVLVRSFGREVRVWQSEPRLHRNRSLPDIILAV
ncbi:uncharacterized protein LOC115736768 [Rhodamnia argentea]|uniref:Uncharacterized protein LOC115736768 n=1 Tax=Rhodamnia argentea TaxID=178133 RepID=A0A8B8NPN1_9MYRT|nr:uncharacterized protein LOC115736768 [Rhodamnia argentea]